ncbi:divalent-cation tolerance protein CutA [Dehalogenimonas sp. THU2]|uniref:divalent-cation tolerance protein CutA n=1 Tax=Dehalogenimonas sp. THU2 TaxID=3151121 RepID=UPI003218BD69
MNEISGVIVLVTAGDNEEANLIARVLLEQKKTACVNIIDGMSSNYWWKGAIENVTESLLVIKTSTTLLDAVIELVKEIHSYDNPEIIALPIIGGSTEYLEWLSASLKTDLPKNPAP